MTDPVLTPDPDQGPDTIGPAGQTAPVQTDNGPKPGDGTVDQTQVPTVTDADEF